MRWMAVAVMGFWMAVLGLFVRDWVLLSMGLAVCGGCVWAARDA